MPKTATVTRTMADKTLAAIITAFGPWISEGYGPVLREDFDGADFAILWEMGAPYGWVHLLGGGIEEEYGFRVPAAKIPATVFAEPMNECVLALYRA